MPYIAGKSLIFRHMEGCRNRIVIIGIVEGKLYYDEKIIKKKLESTIPKYEIPKRIFNINEFPLTDNGKINRKKLAEEYQYEEENNKEKTEITTPLEKKWIV